MNLLFIIFFACLSFAVHAQAPAKFQQKLNADAQAVISKVITWRRHIHENPELGNREVKTALYIANHLKLLGLRVQTGVAVTGVVGLLDTGKPGPVIALRADMDALPVTERNSLPFASKVQTTYNGQATGVMHACGHDTHVAMMMGVAEVLVKNKADLKGTIKFIFQPSEEGAPEGEEGGAALMVKEGVLENPKVDVVFGLHIQSIAPTGTILYKEGGMMAAADWFTIKVKGRQSHGAAPWMGVDPIVISAQIINALQTIVSRRSELTKEPVVVTVGKINSGIRENIIPEIAELAGTIRTLDASMQQKVHVQLKQIATNIAESGGATAEVIITSKTPITYNDPALTAKMAPSLERVNGKEKTKVIHAVTGAEDFAEFQKVVPGLYYFVGAMPANQDPNTVSAHHTPDFMVDEDAFITGVKSLLAITSDYMYLSK